MTTTQAKNKAFKILAAETGLTRAELIRKVKAEAKFEHGSRSNYIKAGGLRLFYTGNENYAGGKANGYGPGVYLSIPHVGMSSTITIKKD